MSENVPISQTDRLSPVYAAASGQTQFDCGFPVQRVDDIQVVLIASDDSETVFNLNTDYTIGNLYPAADAQVTFLSGRASGEKIQIRGFEVLSRETNITVEGKYRSNPVEVDLDRRVMADQELRRDLGQTLRMPYGKSGQIMETSPDGGVVYWDEGSQTFKTGPAYTSFVANTALLTSLQDAGNFYLGTTVETALQELGAKVAFAPQDYGATGTADDSAAIQAAMNAAALVGGQVIVTQAHRSTNTLYLRSGIDFHITSTGSITLDAPQINMFIIDTNAVNVSISGPGLIDANNNATSNTIFGKGLTDCKIIGVRFKNNVRAIALYSNTSDGKPLVRPWVIGNIITHPATSNPVFPILLASVTGGPWVLDCKVNYNHVVGRGLSHGANNGTADQITVQGVLIGEIIGNTSKYGGENGITVSRISRGVIVRGNHVDNNDAHGINIGSGYTAIGFSNPASTDAFGTWIERSTNAGQTISFTKLTATTATLAFVVAPTIPPVLNQYIYLSDSSGSQATGIWEVTGAIVSGAGWSATITAVSVAGVISTSAALSGFVAPGVWEPDEKAFGYISIKTQEVVTYDDEGISVNVVPAWTLYIESTTGRWQVAKTARGSSTDPLLQQIITSALSNTGNVLNGNYSADNRIDYENVYPNDDTSPLADYWLQQCTVTANGNTGGDIIGNRGGTVFRDSTSLVDYIGNVTLGALTSRKTSNPRPASEMRSSGQSQLVLPRGITLQIGLHVASTIETSQAFHQLDTTFTDTLKIIRAGTDDEIILLGPVSDTAPVKISPEGNISTPYGKPIWLYNKQDLIWLKYSLLEGKWVVISRNQPSGGAQRPMRGATGIFFHPDGKAGTASTAIAPNRFFAQPFTFIKPTDLTELSVHVRTAVAGTMRLGIYEDDEDHPGALMIDAGTVDTSVAGPKVITMPVQKVHGRIWVAGICDAGPNLTCCTATNAANGSARTANNAGISGYYWAASATEHAALPVDQSAQTYIASEFGNIPCFLLGG